LKHILIIPSEQFVPENNKLEGIFPYHQAVILQEGGYKVGALSIQLALSLPMIVKGLLGKALKKKSGNATDQYGFVSLLKTGLAKWLKPKKFITKEILDGITVYRIDALYHRPPVANKNHISWIKAGLVCLEEYIKFNGRPDLVHAHEAIYAGMLAEKIREKYGIAYIITEHSTIYARGEADESILKRVGQAYGGSAALFAVSDSFASLLNKLFTTDRFRYLPNVLDRQLEETPGNKTNGQEKKFSFLNIALFKPIKDQTTLLKAFKKIREEEANVELLIAGKGDLSKELMNLVKENGLEQDVRFLGLLDREGVIDELGRCDCFVLSSRYETFGVVLIEAMLFGKPVISTSVGVAPTIITDKVGYVVSPGDAEGLALAMKQMLSTHKSYDPGYIRDFAIRNFGRESFLHKMNKIYSEVE
jgi:glycosyltransferase involved in cell wall biosynthesis